MTKFLKELHTILKKISRNFYENFTQFLSEFYAIFRKFHATSKWISISYQFLRELLSIVKKIGPGNFIRFLRKFHVIFKIILLNSLKRNSRNFWENFSQFLRKFVAIFKKICRKFLRKFVAIFRRIWQIFTRVSHNSYDNFM